MMDMYQFYPTAPALARRAWAKFQNKDFSRILEPSAGDGDLITEMPNWDTPYGRGRPVVDVLEIDVSRHPTLRAKGLSVIGLDFLSLQSGAAYSHVILNPPFSEGAKHVLKAWDIVWAAEIVAIINAETIRNPYSKERQLLVSLIEQYGNVEFIQDAFKGDEVRREADVEVALIYLKKEVCLQEDIFGDLLSSLADDRETGAGLAGDYQTAFEVTLPKTEIETRVATFKAAVHAMRDSVKMEARASYYRRLMGQTMADLMNGAEVSSRQEKSTINHVRLTIGERYGELKDAAWAGIIRSMEVTSRLSSKAQKRVEAEFDQIKKLEFSLTNIYGFLCGLIESQGQIQTEMVCDMFDEISRYHNDNSVFYKGWKSNSRHRVAGMRIKMTRFVLPRNDHYSSGLSWDALQRLRDFDKVSALLDGKVQPEISLEYVFNTYFRELCAGERISSSYFDVRYYPGAQTIHFFPRNKTLIDRLNRTVGLRRQWLPPEGTSVNPDFWTQFEKAEKFDKTVRASVRAASRHAWGDPLHGLFSRMEEDSAQARMVLTDALDKVLTEHGLSTEFQLPHAQADLLMLEAA